MDRDRSDSVQCRCLLSFGLHRSGRRHRGTAASDQSFVAGGDRQSGLRQRPFADPCHRCHVAGTHGPILHSLRDMGLMEALACPAPAVLSCRPRWSKGIPSVPYSSIFLVDRGAGSSGSTLPKATPTAPTAPFGGKLDRLSRQPQPVDETHRAGPEIGDGPGQILDIAMEDAMVSLSERAIYLHHFGDWVLGPEGTLIPLRPRLVSFWPRMHGVIRIVYDAFWRAVAQASIACRLSRSLICHC